MLWKKNRAFVVSSSKCSELVTFPKNLALRLSVKNLYFELCTPSKAIEFYSLVGESILFYSLASKMASAMFTFQRYVRFPERADARKDRDPKASLA